MKDLSYDIADYMTILLSREIQDGNNIFFGVSSHMPAIAALLAKKLHAPECTVLNIPGATDFKYEDMSKYSTASSDIISGASSRFPLAEVFDLAMRGRLDVSFLSGIQFDYNGNVNASVIGDYKKPRLRAPGGAGCAVFMPTAKKIVLWRTKHDKRTFVEKVDFVTSRGNIGAVITPLCVFGFNGLNLYLKSIHGGVKPEEVVSNTAFPVDTDVPVTKPPSEKELLALKQLDVKMLRNIEFEN